jgi:glycerol kinase
MESDSGIALRELKVDGGAARNNLLMQFQADVLKTDCVRPKVLETTALGAAFLAGLGVGFWNSEQRVQETWSEDSTFTPNMSDDGVEGYLAAWAAAVAKA